MNDYDYIRNLPTNWKTYIDGHLDANSHHESLLRAYKILEKIKYLLSIKTPSEIILELIELMETPTKPKEYFEVYGESFKKRMAKLLKKSKKRNTKEE